MPRKKKIEEEKPFADELFDDELTEDEEDEAEEPKPQKRTRKDAF